MKKSYQQTWSFELGYEYQDYLNEFDGQLTCLLSENHRRMSTIEERRVFDLRYFWSNNGGIISQSRRTRALFSSPQFKYYTSKNELVCNWWNSLKPGEKTKALHKDFKYLHQINIKNVFDRLPFQWTESITEQMVLSVEKQPLTIADYGPDTIIVYGKHEKQPDSDEVYLQIKSLLDEIKLTFCEKIYLSECIEARCLLLPWQKSIRPQSISKNLKWIMFANTGYEFIDWKSDLLYGIRFLRQRLNLLGLERVRLLDVSLDKNVTGCEKVTLENLNQILKCYK